MATRREDIPYWKKDFEETLQLHGIKERSLKFQVSVPENIEKLKSHMRKSNLFLFPSEFDSPIFGTEALVAVAARVPILVPRYSGIASLLRKMVEEESVVNETNSETKVDSWKKGSFRR